MLQVWNTRIVAGPLSGDSSPEAIVLGAGSLWVEYANGTASTSTIARYSMNGQFQHAYTVAGSADGLSFDPVTGNAWVLNNSGGNATLQFINAPSGEISTPLDYAAPYMYGAGSTRGYAAVAFSGTRVFLSYTNPANPGDPVVQMLNNGTAPFSMLRTSGILSVGDQGIDLGTGRIEPLPVTDPGSLQMLPDGELLLASRADGAYVFIKHPGTAAQTASFLLLPTGYTAGDALMPSASSGTFYITNAGANDVVSSYVTGLSTHDLYAELPSQNELAQIDPGTGAITPVLTGLHDPEGLAFVPAPSPPKPPSGTGATGHGAAAPQVLSTRLVATAPKGHTAPDAIAVSGSAFWVTYDDGASARGGGTSTIVRYTMTGHVQHSCTAAGQADALAHNAQVGDLWVLNNGAGNSTLQFIGPASAQASAPLSFAAPYVYGTASVRGYDGVAFDGRKVFLSYANPVNPGDPVIQELVNGLAPFGPLKTASILRLGDQGINLATGKLGMLPVGDPGSLHMLQNGELLLTGDANGALIFIKDPGTAQQAASFLSLPNGYTLGDAVMPGASAGTFYITNEGANDIVSATVTGLNPQDLYAVLPSQNELVQIDPANGNITLVLSGLHDPHGLAFVPMPHG